MLYQIGLFCLLQLEDTKCLEANHIGGSARGYPAGLVSLAARS